MQVLELKEPVLKGIQAMGEDLISDGHPAKGPIQVGHQSQTLIKYCTKILCWY